MDGVHQPVMLAEVLEALAVKPAGAYVDATYGRGGHARAVLDRLGAEGRLLVFDRDPDAIAQARRELGGDARVTVIQERFSMLGRHIENLGLAGKVDGILLDLGVSSPQLDDPARGFGFMRDGPLDMRMDPASGMPVRDWLEHARESEIRDVIRRYGEERYAGRIARAIVARRKTAPLATTAELAAVVSDACPTRERDRHPATRTFQALRIFINRELEELAAVLPQALALLAVGGRLAVISFHSLEDRLVKRFMRAAARGDDYPPELPVTASALHPQLRLCGKARHPGAAEVAVNPRARSAVLRVAERVDVGIA